LDYLESDYNQLLLRVFSPWSYSIGNLVLVEHLQILGETIWDNLVIHLSLFICHLHTVSCNNEVGS